MKVSPSILAADLTDLKTTLTEMDPSVVDLIHMDVMDGHFVPAISFGEQYSHMVAKHTSIPLDVHLMVSAPEREIPKYFDLQPYNITFHLEATDFPIRLSQLIRENGIRAGVSLNPGTDVRLLEPILDHMDMVLLMSVEPGFYGQKFIDSVKGKIETLQRMREDRSFEIQVDGGVGTGNVAMLRNLGVDIVVAGSASFRTPDVNANVQDIKKRAEQQ